MEPKRLLIADPSPQTRRLLKSDQRFSDYAIEMTSDGPETLKRLHSFKPELIIVELMLPKMHGIEILGHMRKEKGFEEIGVIITSSQTMIQNYRAAMDRGTTYFLEKPFSADEFFLIVESYFQGNLNAAPFVEKMPDLPENKTFYNPTPTIATSYIRFWGTRGSNPVAGPKYVRYGGNTCCLEVRYGKDLLIIDAGTGIRPLGEMLTNENEINLFIGHTHWDHITGFPFFAPIYRKGCKINIWAPVGFDRAPKEIFSEMLAHAFFPVRLDDMQAEFEFKELRDGDHIKIGNLVLETHYTYHPGHTLCFKIRSPHHTIGYVTDNEMLLGYHGHPGDIGKNHPLLEPHQSLISFLKDCDLLIHEAQYFPEEYQKKVGWGHSSISNATALINATHCHDWVVTHHDPQHSDSDLQVKVQLHLDILHDCHLMTQVRLAYDGLTLPL